ncbi:hypothetical protein HMPREF9336_04129, partial [Segniliparus rugosus ATCC BAA-974]
MGLSWPSAYDWLWDKAQQYWPKADESGLRTAEQSFMAALPDVESAFSNLVSGHQDLVKALGESDSATAAQTKLADIQSRGETLNQIISAEFSMMNAAPQNIDTAKQGLIDKAKTADSNAKSGLMGFLAEYAPSVAQSQKEKAAGQFDSDAKPVHDTYTQSNQKLLQLPDGVDGSDDGPVKTNANYKQVSGTDGTALGPATATRNTSYKSASSADRDASAPATQDASYRSASSADGDASAPATQDASYKQGGGQSPSTSGQGGSQGAGGGQGSGGSGASGGGASTGVQSGAAVADHAAPAAASQAAPASGGGGGVSPSIGGIGVVRLVVGLVRLRVLAGSAVLGVVLVGRFLGRGRRARGLRRGLRLRSPRRALASG